MIGSECCMYSYVPDNSEHVACLAEKIRDEGAKFHDYFTKDGIFSWLEGFFGGWGARLLQWIFTGLLLIVIIIVLNKCATTALPALITSCLKTKATKVMVSQQTSPYADPDPEEEFYDLYEIGIGNP